MSLFNGHNTRVGTLLITRGSQSHPRQPLTIGRSHNLRCTLVKPRYNNKKKALILISSFYRSWGVSKCSCVVQIYAILCGTRSLRTFPYHENITLIVYWC